MDGSTVVVPKLVTVSDCEGGSGLWEEFILMRTRILMVLGAIFGLSLIGGTAQAGLLPTNFDVKAEGGNFRYVYSVTLTDNEELRPGDYFTIYDFYGYVDGSVTVPDTLPWKVTQNFTGVTPSGIAPIDDPSIMNFTFTYVGDEVIPGPVGLGDFTLVSKIGTSVDGDYFTSRTHRLDGKFVHQLTPARVPVKNDDGVTVPEPTSLALLGLGLPLIGAYRTWRGRRRQS